MTRPRRPTTVGTDEVPGRGGAWAAVATPTTPGWLRVPSGSDRAEQARWVEETTTELRSAWENLWHPEFAEPMRTMLREVAESRTADSLLDLLYLPWALPAAVRLRVRAGLSAPAGAWRDAGFVVDRYDGADIGPGLQCIAQESFTTRSGDVTVVHAQYVFDDGEASVVVTVEPTMLEMFGHMTPGLHGILGSLQVTDDRGRPFASRPVPEGVAPPGDEWRLADDE